MAYGFCALDTCRSLRHLSSLLLGRADQQFVEYRRLCVLGVLKEVDPLFKRVGNLGRCLLMGAAFRLNIDHGLPERRAAKKCRALCSTVRLCAPTHRAS